MNFPLFPLFNALTSADMCVYLRLPRSSVYRQPWIARDIAWRVRYLRTKDAHKQLARTSLIDSYAKLNLTEFNSLKHTMTEKNCGFGSVEAFYSVRVKYGVQMLILTEQGEKNSWAAPN